MDIDSNAALGAAVQHAAKHLKKGHLLSVTIENGGYSVSLIGDTEQAHYPDNNNITDDILVCVRVSGGGVLEEPEESPCTW